MTIHVYISVTKWQRNPIDSVTNRHHQCDDDDDDDDDRE